MSSTKNEGTIQQVVTDGLCTGCGTCVGICPASAIVMPKNSPKGLYAPKVESELCNQCGLCMEVCPGCSVNFRELNKAIFTNEIGDVLIGNYINCYIGHATDYNVRYHSASGGAVSALLIFALEQGLIDGALVTKMSDKNPLEPEVFMATGKEQIISASKSKYCPVPLNIGLKQIGEQDGRFAVVGLPCHIHGIRKAELLHKDLREKIVLHFGIFCSSTLNFSALKYAFCCSSYCSYFGVESIVSNPPTK